MPVTARLSREFYERFGDKIADELVNWFNQVDATYRNELRELNELNFARFDARLEQRLGELRADMGARITGLDAAVDTRITSLRAELETQIATLRAAIDTGIAKSNAALERRLGEQTRWLLGAWGILLATVLRLWFR